MNSLNDIEVIPALPRIMLVEDDAINRRLLSMWLQTHASAVLAFESAETALAGFDDAMPDMLISDIRLNGMSGLELSAHLKARDPNFPVILVTAFGDQEALLSALNLGADHLVLKPVERHALLHYVDRLAEVKQTRDRLAASQQEVISKNAQLESMRLKEQETCAGIQELILYRYPQQQLPHVQTAYSVVPSQIVNGDFLDHFAHNDSCTDFIIGDAMGKGLTAALLAAGVKTGLMRILAEPRVESAHTVLSVQQILQGMQSQTHQSLAELESFVTLLYTRIDTALAKVEWVDCGHGKLILQRAHQKHSQLLSGGNMPLGLNRKEVFETCDTPLLQGDRIFMVTDGLTETISSAGVMLDFDGIAELLGKHRTAALQEAVHRTVYEISELGTALHQISDDKTMLALELGELPMQHAYAHLCVPAAMASLPIARQWLLDQLDRCAEKINRPIDTTWRDEFALGCTECISNILRHGLTGENLELEISAILHGDYVHLELLYQGVYFNRRKFGSQLPAELSEGSYGLFLIDQLFDSVMYHPDTGRYQTVVLRKKLPNAAI